MSLYGFALHNEELKFGRSTLSLDSLQSRPNKTKPSMSFESPNNERPHEPLPNEPSTSSTFLKPHPNKTMTTLEAFRIAPLKSLNTWNNERSPETPPNKTTTLEAVANQETTLESLPNEMLTEILQYCNNLDFDYKAMRSRIEMRAGNQGGKIRHGYMILTNSGLSTSSYEFRPSQCAKFIRTILGRPELSKHVLRFDAMVNCEWKMPINTLVTDTEVTNLQVALASVDGRIARKDSEGTQGRKHVDFDKDSAVAIAMLLLPRLRHLSLSIHGWEPEVVPDFKTHYCLITKVIRKALSDPIVPFLQHLESVSVQPVTRDIKTRRSNYDQDIGPFNRLATIKKVVVEEFMLTRSDNKRFRLPSVVDAELRLCRMHLARFDRFLRCFPALERFSYEHIGPNYPGTGEDGYSLNHVVQLLSRCKSSLKYLCLRPSFFREYYMHVSLKIQPLTMFQCLEDIDVIAFDKWVDTRFDYNRNRTTLDPRISPMVDLIPSCIKHLTLRQACGNTLLHARGLLEEREKHNRVPSLESLRIILDEHFVMFDLTLEFNVLRQIADNCGIRLKVEIYVRETGRISNIQRDIRQGYGRQDGKQRRDGFTRFLWESTMDLGQLSLQG
ncbi:uncharacterized protein PAC_11890 [Phialocephala subalpina]|uniref:Uncharacterized protein n=1 Tax=Phialocephala subalpina TaxID=576137 RepID=A0A1L7XAC8_9HELO|nr:uncharacterized protein PAC_11890 [Phialocephala subalpina]